MADATAKIEHKGVTENKERGNINALPVAPEDSAGFKGLSVPWIMRKIERALLPGSGEPNVEVPPGISRSERRLERKMRTVAKILKSLSPEEQQLLFKALEKSIAEQKQEAGKSAMTDNRIDFFDAVMPKTWQEAERAVCEKFATHDVSPAAKAWAEAEKAVNERFHTHEVEPRSKRK